MPVNDCNPVMAKRRRVTQMAERFVCEANMTPEQAVNAAVKIEFLAKEQYAREQRQWDEYSAKLAAKRREAEKKLRDLQQSEIGTNWTGHLGVAAGGGEDGEAAPDVG